MSTSMEIHQNYLCSEVIFKHPKGLKLELTCSNTGVMGHGHLKFTASSKLEVNYPATSIKEWRLGRVPENTQKATQFGMSVLMVSIRIFFCPIFENSKQEHSQL